LALACALLARTSVHPAIEPPSVYGLVSPPAFAIRDLLFPVLAISALVFVIVAGLILYTLIRFGRRRAGSECQEDSAVDVADPSLIDAERSSRQGAHGSR
jgi:heme/copper-type cytochrome/quinol oxidase subunit 2